MHYMALYSGVKPREKQLLIEPSPCTLIKMRCLEQLSSTTLDCWPIN